MHKPFVYRVFIARLTKRHQLRFGVFLLILLQIAQPLSVLALEAGNAPNSGEVTTTDSKTALPLDRALESGQASTLAPVGAAGNETMPAIKPSIPQAQTTASTQTVTLPSVAGLSTLGSKSDVDDSSGAFLYSLPVRLPAGRAGLTPSVEVSYDSRRNNQTSYIGLGWDIALPKIERENKNGADVMYDETNFTSSEYGELAQTAATEQQFGQYTVKYGFGEFQYRDDNSWVITDKDGVTSIYGATILDRIDTGNPDQTELWALSKQIDQNGNEIDYLYTKSNGKLYPQSIIYNGGMARADFTYQTFNYDTPVPQYDPVTNKPIANDIGDVVDYGSGVRVTADRKLTDITVTAAGERRLDYKFDSGNYLNGVSGEFGSINFTYRQSVVAPAFTDSTDFTTFTPPDQRPVWKYTWDDYYKNRTPQMPLYHNWPYSIVPFYNGNMTSTWMDIDNDGKLELLYFFTDFQNPSDRPNTDWQTKNPANYSNKMVMEVYRVDPAGQGGMSEDVSMRLTDLTPSNFELNSTITTANISDWVVSGMASGIANGRTAMMFYFRNTRTGASYGGYYMYDTVQKKYTAISTSTPVPPLRAQITGTTTPAIPASVMSEINALSQPVISWVDIDNDNNLDLVVNYLTGMRVYHNDGTINGVTAFTYMPNYDLVGVKINDTTTPTFTLWRDINGDGLDDFYRSGMWFLNRRTYFQYSESYTLAGVASQAPITKASDLMDINGDGLLDIPAYQRINTGAGFEVVSQKAINNMGTKTSLYQTNVAYNASLNPGVNPSCPYYYSCDGAKLYSSALIPTLPWSNMGLVNSGDFDGDGNTDYLYSYGGTDYLIYGGKNTTPADFTQRDYVGKMIGITNNTLSGPQSTTITYKKADLTNEFIDGKPATVWVVDTLDNGSASNGDAVKYTYNYTGGRIYKDATELSKQTPGFASVTETDSLGFATTRYFHQVNGDDAASFETGDDSFAKLGKMYRSEVRNKSGELLSVTRTKWSTYDISPLKQYLFDELDEQYDLIKKVATAVGYTDDVTIGEVTRVNDYGAIQPASWSTIDGNWTDVGDDALIAETEYTATLPLVRPVRSVIRDAANNQVLREMTYTWDGGVLSHGLLTESTDRVDSGTVRVNQMQYSPFGTLIKSINSAGDATVYVLDSSQVAPVSITNPLGQTTNIVMDYLTGKPKKITTPDGIVSEYTYDPIYDFETSYTKNGIPVRSASENGRAIYQNESNTITYKFTDPTRYLKSGNNAISTITYLDTQGNIGTVASSADGNTYYTYNARNEEASVTPSGSSQAIKNTYDQYDRLASVVSPLGTSNYSYNGLSVTENKPNGGTKTTTTNVRGQLLSVADNYGTANYVYDKLGNLTSLSDADGNKRDFTYDMVGQMKQMTDYYRPGDTTYGVYDFTYDILGREVSQTRPDGTSVTTTYDKLSRPLVTQTGSTTVTASYDTCQVGRLCSITRDNNYQSVFTYGQDGLASKEVKTINGVSREFDYAYNADGSLFLASSPLGELEYYYQQMGNSGGKPTQIYWNGNDPARKTAGQYNNSIAQIQYAQDNNSPSYISNYFASTGSDPAKRVSMTTNYTYDGSKLAFLNRSYVSLYSPKTNGVISDENYAYDSVGNISRIDDAGTLTKKTTAYAYDLLDRLTRFQVFSPLNGSPADTSYTYSPAGNITSMTPLGGTASIMSYNSDGQGLTLPVAGIATSSPALPVTLPVSAAPVCVLPQTLDATTNTCTTPVAPAVPPAPVAQVCVLPQTLDTTTNTCTTPLAPAVPAALLASNCTGNTCRFWVGGSGNWDGTTTTHWSTTSGGPGGASVPTSSNDVFFDANSGAGVVAPVYAFPSNNNSHNLNFTGFTGTFAGNGAINIYGSLVMGAGMTWTNSNAINFLSTSSETITSNGIVRPINSNSATFDGVGGTWTLQDDFSPGYGINLINGTFNANDKNVTAGFFSCALGGTSILNMGSGLWTINGAYTGAGDYFQVGSSCTLNSDTSTIKLTGNFNSPVTSTFNGGGMTLHNLWVATSGTGELYITSGLTFNDLRIDAGRIVGFQNGQTQRMNTFTAAGTAGNLITLDVETPGGAAFNLIKLGSGQISSDYLNIQHSIATPANTWFAGTHSVNNQAAAPAGSGWIFTDPNAVATPPALVVVTCVLPQILDSATNTCKTPAPVTSTCVLPQVLDTVTNTCKTPIPVCALPQVLDTTTNTCKTPVPVSLTAKVLVVGGGGGGWVGGGGAGGYQYDANHILTGQVYTILVGNGGTGGSSFMPPFLLSQMNGANSSFDNITAIGGGRGAGNLAAGNGGSGGGGNITFSPGTGNQGSSGGITSTASAGGGGGGAGGSGGPNVGLIGGAGGVGIANSITGSAVTYAGGGGGLGSAGLYQQGGGGAGGDGGGGQGGSFYDAVAGTMGLGGGGGGGDLNFGGGSPGGGGVVIISYATADFAGYTITGGTVTTDGANTVRTFTSSGTLTISALVSVVMPKSTLSYVPKKEKNDSTNVWQQVLTSIFGVQKAYAQTTTDTCTLPQVMNTTTDTCETPSQSVPTTPTVTTCVSPQTLDPVTNTCTSPASTQRATTTTATTTVTTNTISTNGTTPTTSSAPSINDLITSLLLKIQSGQFTIKQDGRVFTIVDTSNATTTRSQTSGTITINKGQTTATVTFPDQFAETPEILVFPKDNTTQPTISVSSQAGFTIILPNKDYINKRTFTYLAFLSDNSDAESLPDDIPATTTEVYNQQKQIEQTDVLEGTLSNLYTNPQAIIKYQNTYLVYNKLGQLTNALEYNAPVCTSATASDTPVCAAPTLKSSQTRTYTGDSRLESIDTDTYNVSYTYDPSGNKTSETTIYKVNQTKTTTIYWSDTERTYTTVCALTTATACPTDRDEKDILVNGKIYATVTVKNGVESYKYYVTDTLGTSNLVIGEDGSVIEQTDNNPYGDSRYTVNDPQTASYYALHEKNDTTGLIDMEARMYDPNTTQFTSQDPTSLYFPTTYLTDPQQLNMYSYARDNPLRYNDPTGKCLPGCLAVLAIPGVGELAAVGFLGLLATEVTIYEINSITKREIPYGNVYVPGPQPTVNEEKFGLNQSDWEPKNLDNKPKWMKWVVGAITTLSIATDQYVRDQEQTDSAKDFKIQGQPTPSQKMNVTTKTNSQISNNVSKQTQAVDKPLQSIANEISTVISTIKKALSIK